MKQSKVFSYLVIFVFLIVFLAYCGPREEEAQVAEEAPMAAEPEEVTTPRDYLIEKMVLEEGMVKADWWDAMVSLAETIAEDHERFRAAFLSGQPSGLFDLSESWRSVRQEKSALAAQKEAEIVIEFIPEKIFLTDKLEDYGVERVVLIDGVEDNIDCYAKYTFEIRIVLKEKEVTLQNTNGAGGEDYKHRAGCRWID